jgi:hypothetical protein
MHIESRDLIISVHGSRNDYYKPENLNECCITTEIQHTFKTLKNPESESVFPPSYESYTASHNDGLLISEATKKNNFNSRAVNMEHENLHDSFCVCVHVRSVSLVFRKKRDFLEKGYFKGFERIKEKSSTCLTSQKCRNHQHESLVLNQSKSINQSINHVSEVSA